jgi:hypothetical protein
MIIFTKIFAIILAILVISKSMHDYKKRQESLMTAIFWAAAWIGIVYVALVPKVFYKFILDLGNENIGIGTFAGIAFVLIFFVTYRVYVKAHRLEQKIKDIVMKIGIKDIEK